MELTVSVPDAVGEGLEQAAREQGRPVSDLVRHLLERWMEDFVDVREARAALAEARETGTIPWEQVKAEVGL